jgi:hypothetical protein
VFPQVRDPNSKKPYVLTYPHVNGLQDHHGPGKLCQVFTFTYQDMSTYPHQQPTQKTMIKLEHVLLTDQSVCEHQFDPRIGTPGHPLRGSQSPPNKINNPGPARTPAGPPAVPLGTPQ